MLSRRPYYYLYCFRQGHIWLATAHRYSVLVIYISNDHQAQTDDQSRVMLASRLRNQIKCIPRHKKWATYSHVSLSGFDFAPLFMWEAS